MPAETSAEISKDLFVSSIKFNTSSVKQRNNILFSIFPNDIRIL